MAITNKQQSHDGSVFCAAFLEFKVWCWSGKFADREIDRSPLKRRPQIQDVTNQPAVQHCARQVWIFLCNRKKI